MEMATALKGPGIDAPKKITGKRPSIIPQLNDADARAVVRAGRGWSNKRRPQAYDDLPDEFLYALLESWSPIVRERAAVAIGRREEVSFLALKRLLESDRIEARYGACQALVHIRGDKSIIAPARPPTVEARRPLAPH